MGFAALLLRLAWSRWLAGALCWGWVLWVGAQPLDQGAQHGQQFLGAAAGFELEQRRAEIALRQMTRLGEAELVDQQVALPGPVVGQRTRYRLDQFGPVGLRSPGRDTARQGGTATLATEAAAASAGPAMFDRGGEKPSVARGEQDCREAGILLEQCRKQNIGVDNDGNHTAVIRYICA